MATIRFFEDIESWQLSRQLDRLVFKATQKEKFSRDYKLRDQILSSSGSIMDNIAEGFERNGNKEFVQFMSISKGSCGEVKSQLYRAVDRGYIDQDEFREMYEGANVISKKISGLMTYLSNSDYKGAKFK